MPMAYAMGIVFFWKGVLMGRTLKDAREYLGLSLEYVARYMNMAKEELQAAEEGQKELDAHKRHMLEKLYGISLDKREETATELFSDVPMSGEDRKAVGSLVRFKERLGRK